MRRSLLRPACAGAKLQTARQRDRRSPQAVRSSTALERFDCRSSRPSAPPRICFPVTGDVCEMIEIDGSYGEGGGAVLRQALGLAAYSGTPLSIIDIRAGREQPGLRPQHLRAVQAVGAVCGARVTGAGLGSKELTFVPTETREGEFEFDIGTAGSTGLVLMTVLLPCLCHEGTFEFGLVGGTDVPFSPTPDYLSHVMLPTLLSFGSVTLSVDRRGYYPQGGGRIAACIMGGTGLRTPLALSEPGLIKGIRGISHASTELAERRVAERQADSVRHLLERLGFPLDIDVEYVDSASVGSGITIWTESTSGASMGGSSLGRPGKTADEVGREAANQLLRAMNSEAAVDRYLADQLIPYLAVAGGTIVAADFTPHLASAMYVAETILGTEFRVEGSRISAPPPA